MPQTATVPHPSHWVSYGPLNTQGGAGDWCVLANPEPKHLAPGGVVLCKRGTTQLHPEATRYAREAWNKLALYSAYKGPTRWDRGHRLSQASFMPPAPVLTEANVRNANKYTRRAITTKADRIAAEKIIKRPVARAS